MYFACIFNLILVHFIGYTYSKSGTETGPKRTGYRSNNIVYIKEPKITVTCILHF
jgi:hypothetical protein